MTIHNPKELPSEIELKNLYPSQLYINATKLEKLIKQIQTHGKESIEPVPVHWLRNKLILTDGHTRCVAFALLGYDKIPIIYDNDELDWEMYDVCVQWCEQAHFTSVLDLQHRIISNEDYEKLWLQKCKIMQDEIISLRLKSKLDTDKNK